MAFGNSVVSYPVRGEFGDNKYSGNCSGHLIRDFLESYHPSKKSLFADPSIGGGTTRDVATALGVRFKGSDLRDGFNLIRDSLSEFLGEKADSIFWHPPYWDMINYSGNQWGDEAHPYDLSRMKLEDFCNALQLSLLNIHEATAVGGHYGILMGNLRRDGTYFNLSSLVERVAPGVLVDEIIKIQHNCLSGSKKYRGKVIRIEHEKLLVFRRTESRAALEMTNIVYRRGLAQENAVWINAINFVLLSVTKPMSADEVINAIKTVIKPENEFWGDFVREQLKMNELFVEQNCGGFILRDETKKTKE